MFLILSQKQIEDIKVCGHILAEVFDSVLKLVKPGVSTFEINQFIESELKKRGAASSFLNYEVGGEFYPSSSCISKNADLVHGLPSKEDVLKEGDIVSIDAGAYFKGVHTDMARTVGVGKISENDHELIDITKKCLEIGVSAAKPDQNIGMIGKRIEEEANKRGLSVVKELVGHGIGTELHMEPQIPNYGDGLLGPSIKNGMALAIEPMLSTGSNKVKTKEDGWTVTMKDGSNCAHFEDTVVIIDGKTVIVTR
ncbi:MAG: type I methionyl aminopeptidase [Patescibacteria group bacterium]